MDDLKEGVAKALEKAISHKDFHKEQILPLTEVPPEPKLGDYAFPCFRLAKPLKKKPQEIAKQLAKKIKKPKGIEKVEVAGAYVNFFVEKGSFAKHVVEEILKHAGDYGTSPIGEGKKVMVEYSGPNTNKPLHVGHLRNDALGMAVSNLLEATAYKVIRANILSNRGIHICKSMLAYQLFGGNKKPEDDGVKSDHFVGHYYVMFQEKVKEDPDLETQAKDMLKLWEQGDPTVRKLWDKMDSWAVDGFKKTYKIFGSKFDVYFKESDFYDKARPLIDKAIGDGVFDVMEDNAVTVNLEEYGLGKKTILRSDGTAIYLTNDLALTKHKFENYGLDKAIWVVASEQNLYFKQLFKILDLMGYKWAKDCLHLSYGLVFLPHGRLKSREGLVVDADHLIVDAMDAAAKEIKKRHKLGEKEVEKRSKDIGLAAIKFFMLKTDPVKDMLFDLKKAISYEGETGPYVQYSYARARSILRKAKLSDHKHDYSRLTKPVEKELITVLSNFQEVVRQSARQLTAHILCQYLIEAAAKFNTFYHALPVLKAKDELARARLGLVEATAIVLKNGLKLLGISALEEM